MKRAFTEVYSWLASHGSVVFLGLFFLVWVDIVVRQVPRPFLADWAFWAEVAFWILILLLTSFVSHHLPRIRRSIRRAIYFGCQALVLVIVLVAFILRLGELFWSPVVGLFAVFIISALHDVVHDVRRGSVLPPITLPPEEQSILRNAQQLIYNLQLSKRFIPLYINWASDIYSDEVTFGDGFRKHTMLLPLSLKNKLSPEELRVLIADYLVRQKPQVARFVVSVLKSFGLLIAYGILFVYEVDVIIKIPYAGVAWWIGYALIASFSMKLFLAEYKKQSLATDRMTAKLVGKEIFLDVLRKIYDLKLPDMERLSAKRDLRARLFAFFKPTLLERMENLSGM